MDNAEIAVYFSTFNFSPRLFLSNPKGSKAQGASTLDPFEVKVLASPPNSRVWKDEN